MYHKLFICVLALASSALAADPSIGTWKINLEKSKLENPAVWKGRTIVIEPSGDGKNTYRITISRPQKDGTVQKREDLRTFDGKERPSAMNPGETEMSERIDARTRRTTFSKDGKQLSVLTSTVDRD